MLPHRSAEHRRLERALFGRGAQASGGCLIWTGSKNKSGYGKISFGRGCIGYTHRLAWLLSRSGRLIPRNREIDHTCNNRACIAPAHLIVVTHARNMTLGKERRALRKVS